MQLSRSDIKTLPKVKRLNIINSITGIKPGNLVGSISEKDGSNLAIISSVVHLGSNPALIGYILRPSEDVRRDTYENIIENGFYTINHIQTKDIQKAHYTSTKMDPTISEFEVCNFTEEYLFGFKAPFVKESRIKMGLEIREIIDIKSNNTKMVVGEILHLIVDDSIMSENGYFDLEKSESVGISGLNSYYAMKKLADFPYARMEELPNFHK